MMPTTNSVPSSSRGAWTLACETSRGQTQYWSSRSASSSSSDDLDPCSEHCRALRYGRRHHSPVPSVQAPLSPALQEYAEDSTLEPTHARCVGSKDSMRKKDFKSIVRTVSKTLRRGRPAFASDRSVTDGKTDTDGWVHVTRKVSLQPDNLFFTCAASDSLSSISPTSPSGWSDTPTLSEPSPKSEFSCNRLRRACSTRRISASRSLASLSMRRSKYPDLELQFFAARRSMDLMDIAESALQPSKPPCRSASEEVFPRRPESMPADDRASSVESLSRGSGCLSVDDHILCWYPTEVRATRSDESIHRQPGILHLLNAPPDRLGMVDNPLYECVSFEKG